MTTYADWLSYMQKQAPQAQQQYNQASAAYKANPSLYTTGQSMGGGTYQQYAGPNEAAYSAYNSADQNMRAFDLNSAENRAEGNRLQAYDLARGGIDRLQNDQTDEFVRQRLKESAGKDGGPYDATTRNAMFTAAVQGDGSKARVQSIMDSAAQRGMDPNDPSVQAALRNSQDKQAQSAQRARLGIDLEANRANYGAQQSAIDRLGGYNMDRQAQMTSAEDRLRNMLWNEGVPKGVPQAPQVPQAASTIPKPAATAAAPGFVAGTPGVLTKPKYSTYSR